MPTHSYKITDAVHDEARERVVITLDLLEGGKRLDTRYLGFPASLTEDQLKKEVEKYASVYFQDHENGKLESERERVRLAINKNLAKLVGKQSNV